MNSAYSIDPAPVIRFGANVSEKLPELLPSGCRRVLFLAGKHAASSAEKITALLEKSGRSVLQINGITPEPPPAEIDRIAEEGRRFQADCVAALGGGSVIDGAKAAAIMIPAEGKCMEYFTGKKQFGKPGLFFAAMPTTAGTGAEMTSNSVLTDPETKIKQSLRSPLMTPALALVDPLLTLDASPALTAACGLDALVQAAESYTSIKANTYTKTLALTALKKIAFALPEAYRNPESVSARTDMAEGSMLTGIAFAKSGLGAVHGLAHPVGSLRKVPHGVACAVLMPYVFRFNAETHPLPYGEMAEYLGTGKTAGDFLNFITNLTRELNIPATFRDYGFCEDDFPFVIANCRSGSMKSNPREMSDDEVKTILRQLV